jgi:hypothetical protein
LRIAQKAVLMSNAAALATAQARVDAVVNPAMELYAERNRFLHRFYRVSLRDLRRLNDCLTKLSDDDLRRVAVFAEGLAEWASGDAELPDGQANG